MSGDSIPTEKNPDFVGKQEAARAAEKVDKSRGTERVWDFTCDNPKCDKPKEGSGSRHKTKPVGQIPKGNCDSCGDWNWRKTGERERPIQVKEKETK